MDRRSWLMLLVLSSIWGASYLFIKIGLRDLSPAMVAFIRVGLAALVLAPVARHRGALGDLRGRGTILVLVAAVQVAAPFLLIAAGEQEISSALAGILVSSAAIFTAILAIWVDHEERSTGLRLVGVFVGFVGVVLLFGLDLSGSALALLGGFAVLMAGLGYAVGGFIVKHRLSDVQPLGVVTWVMVSSALLLAPAALATAPDAGPPLGPLAAVAALGLLGTGVAFVIFYALIARVGPAKSLLVSYIAPGFAVIYGGVLLDERITATTVGGLVLILIGSWLGAEGRMPRRLPARGDPLPATVDPGAGAVAPQDGQPAAMRRRSGAAR